MIRRACMLCGHCAASNLSGPTTQVLRNPHTNPVFKKALAIPLPEANRAEVFVRPTVDGGAFPAHTLGIIASGGS